MSDKFQNTVFVGGLNPEINQASLNTHFSKFGDIIHITVPGAKNSKGYAFIKFKDSESMKNTLAQKNHAIGGRPLNVTPALVPKEARKLTTSKTKKKLFIGGLGNSTTESDLADYFSKFGKVVNAYLIYNEFTKKTKRFGFVEFETEKQAEAAQICNTHIIKGRTCFSKYQIHPKAKYSKQNVPSSPKGCSQADTMCNSDGNSDKDSWCGAQKENVAENAIFAENSQNFQENYQNYQNEVNYSLEPIYCYENVDQSYYMVEPAQEQYYWVQDTNSYEYNNYYYQNQGYEQAPFAYENMNYGYYENQQVYTQSSYDPSYESFYYNGQYNNISA